MTERPGIYEIRHLPSGKVYVGSSMNISKRWSRHRIDLRLGRHLNKHLQSAWNKYGEDAFVFTVVEFTEDLTVREQFWMDQTQCYDRNFGFNKCPEARSSRGRVATKEARLAHSAAMRRLWSERPEVFANRTPRVGVQLHNAKLTPESVGEIRLKYGSRTGPSKPHGGVTYATLAKEYGVGMPTIANVITGETWKEVSNGL